MEVLYETERLIVRKWLKKDYLDLYEYAKEAIVTKYVRFKPYHSKQDAVERIEKLIAQYKEDKIVASYAIVNKRENKVIGSIDIMEYLPRAGGIITLSYVLSPFYQGHGYMTEAVKGMFKYIKKNNLAKRIEASHDVENIKSGNVMKRAGMTFEGISRRSGENNLHSRYDIAYYSILFEEIED